MKHLKKYEQFVYKQNDQKIDEGLFWKQLTPENVVEQNLKRLKDDGIITKLGPADDKNPYGKPFWKSQELMDSHRWLLNPNDPQTKAYMQVSNIATTPCLIAKKLKMKDGSLSIVWKKKGYGGDYGGGGHGGGGLKGLWITKIKDDKVTMIEQKDQEFNDILEKSGLQKGNY